MKKLMIISLAALTLGLAGCQTAREQNAVAGGAIVLELVHSLAD
jgi:hypothetical protein